MNERLIEMTETVVRRVHCTLCYPDGGDIDRDGFQDYSLLRQDGDGTEQIPVCRYCGGSMVGRNLWINGHSADGFEPAY